MTIKTRNGSWNLGAAVALAMAALLGPAAGATPMSAQTRQALSELRDAVRKWAPICSNGAMGLNQPPECAQGDMLEYSGMSCASGDRARCDDVKRSQSANGRFWRNPTAAVQGDPKNSFSRDMLMGVFDYVIATRDRAAFERFYDYLRHHHNKMCDDATDNRCRLIPGTWGIFGKTMKLLGMKRPLLVKLSQGTVDLDLLLSANTVPAGYQMELVAHHILVRRSLGENSAVMREAAGHIAKRQPLNPLFVYVRDGATDEAGKLALEICPPQKGARAHDIFFQRELKRNAAGKIVVIRDWKDSVPPLASDIASGHDCLIVLNWLLGGPGH